MELKPSGRYVSRNRDGDIVLKIDRNMDTMDERVNESWLRVDNTGVLCVLASKVQC